MDGGVRLRDVVQADLPIMFQHQLDPHANRLAAFSPRDWEEFTAHWTKIFSDESVIKKTIVFDGTVAGNIVSFERSGKRLVGYWIGREFWGKGIATKALAKFLGHVQARPLYAYVATHNMASIRVLEKCGFTIVGHDRTPGDAHREEVDEVVLRMERPT